MGTVYRGVRAFTDLRDLNDLLSLERPQKQSNNFKTEVGLEAMEIQNQVKKYRKEQDITQAQLAKKLDVSRQTVNAIETGKYDPSLELALKTAEFFDVKVEEIFELN